MNGNNSTADCLIALGRYKMATDRLSDFKLGTGIIIKGGKDWRGIGQPQVEMHHNCYVFHLFCILLLPVTKAQ